MVKVKKGVVGELNTLHQRMERMMESVLHRHGHSGSAVQDEWCPSADLCETETEVVILLEVAGVDPDSLDVTLEDDMLRVTGKRHEMPIRRTCIALHQMEIEYGPFERLFNVPVNLDGDAALARLDHGFLEIRIPKPSRTTTESGRVEIQTK